MSAAETKVESRGGEKINRCPPRPHEEDLTRMMKAYEALFPIDRGRKPRESEKLCAER